MCRAAVPLTVAIAYFDARRFRHTLLEPIDVAADRRNPVRVEAILDVLPLVAANLWFDQRDEFRGLRRSGNNFTCWVQFLYLASAKLVMTLLRTRCATSSIPWETVRVMRKPSCSQTRVNETR